jgi:hypothetical protein
MVSQASRPTFLVVFHDLTTGDARGINPRYVVEVSQIAGHARFAVLRGSTVVLVDARETIAEIIATNRWIR